jgi:hypothetical protein
VARISELRRKLLVDRSLQGRMIIRVAFYWALYHAALWHALVLVQYFQHRFAGLSGQPARSFWDQYAASFQNSQAILIAAVLLLPAVIWETLRQTHRVAGPLFRFQSTLQCLIDGGTPAPVKLRKGDLLTSFEQTMNEFLIVNAERTKLTRNPADGTQAQCETPRQRVVV